MLSSADAGLSRRWLLASAEMLSSAGAGLSSAGSASAAGTGFCATLWCLADGGDGFTAALGAAAASGAAGAAGAAGAPGAKTRSCSSASAANASAACRTSAASRSAALAPSIAAALLSRSMASVSRTRASLRWTCSSAFTRLRWLAETRRSAPPSRSSATSAAKASWSCRTLAPFCFTSVRRRPSSCTVPTSGTTPSPLALALLPNSRASASATEVVAASPATSASSAAFALEACGVDANAGDLAACLLTEVAAPAIAWAWLLRTAVAAPPAGLCREATGAEARLSFTSARCPECRCLPWGRSLPPLESATRTSPVTGWASSEAAAATAAAKRSHGRWTPPWIAAAAKDMASSFVDGAELAAAPGSA
mmetsp:Transcript_75640/g.162208  ORF Transcript_75640/g.162208 Transcript_75640/m.162208 type:complete len:367 (-) Transcript_75640:44-1144(-)